jgi:RNA polymerase sigma-70 factor (ECF subfamily)
MKKSALNKGTETILRLVPSQSRQQVPVKSDEAVDEDVLFGLIVKGDTLAFEMFYKIYYPRLFRFILSLTRDPESVEELIQETLLVVWNKPDRFNYESKISTWVFGIAHNKALKSMSKNARRKNDLNVDDLQEAYSNDEGSAAQSWEDKEWLDNTLGILTPDQRAVIELTFYYDLNYQEIAKMLNCPENTVKTRMFHARKKLKAFAKNQENQD